MSKLTKAQYKAHNEACALLEKDRLSEDERWFVLENWQESARHVNSAAGAFFTPLGLARDLNIEVNSGRSSSVLDLCAGIGALAFNTFLRGQWDGGLKRLVCVEINPDYIAVGRKVLPEAEWIEADVFSLPDLGERFDYAIGNPPFGKTPRKGSSPRYTGPAFEYHVIDIASDLADWGVFILPQMSAPFVYSGQPCFQEREGDAYRAFAQQTGITLSPSCGIDTSIYRSDWRGTAPATEIVTADFAEARASRLPDQADLFVEAA